MGWASEMRVPPAQPETMPDIQTRELVMLIKLTGIIAESGETGQLCGA